MDGAGDTFDAGSWLNSYSSCSKGCSKGISNSYNWSGIGRSIDSSPDSCDSSNSNTAVVAKAAIAGPIAVEWYY